MPYLEGATNLGKKAMPCWKVDDRPKCTHEKKHHCNQLNRPIRRRPFSCIYYKAEEGEKAN